MNTPVPIEFSPYLFWGLEIVGIIVVSYLIIMKKWIFSDIEKGDDNPWKFGGTFLIVVFLMTFFFTVVALVWFPALIVASIYLFGAFLYFLRRKIDVKVEDSPENCGPYPGSK